MCDFAADAAAVEQLMVGRTLSVARVRELNAKDYFYQMLKDNPEMLNNLSGDRERAVLGCHRLSHRCLSGFRSSVAGHDPDSHRGVQVRHAGHCFQRPLEHQRDVRLSYPAAYRRYDRPRRIDKSRRSLWRRRDVFRDEARIRPRGASISRLQNDLVSDFHLRRLLARRRPSRVLRRAPAQRRWQGPAGSERDHGDGGGKESRPRLRPYRFSGAATVGEIGQRHRREGDLGSSVTGS